MSFKLKTPRQENKLSFSYLGGVLFWSLNEIYDLKCLRVAHWTLSTWSIFLFSTLTFHGPPLGHLIHLIYRSHLCHRSHPIPAVDKIFSFLRAWYLLPEFTKANFLNHLILNRRRIYGVVYIPHLRTFLISDFVLQDAKKIEWILKVFLADTLATSSRLTL